MWGLTVIPFLAAMIVSDFRSRTVEAWILAVSCILIAGVSAVEYGLRGALTNILANATVCLLTGICIIIYLKIRKIHPAQAVGEGDIIFILALTPLFTLKGFLTFMTVSSILTLMMWGLHTLLYRKRDRKSNPGSVPLISALGICLTIHLAAASFGLYRFIAVGLPF